MLLPEFQSKNIKTVLDYGSGGSDWKKAGFDTESGKSAKNYFSLNKISRYEPARNIDQRVKSECVVCIDVLEHIFISDVPNVLRDIFCYAEKLVVLNVACYPAAALLPNRENAHITIRGPAWWKGVLDTISIEFPAVNVLLICSVEHGSIMVFETWCGHDWVKDKNFKIDLPKVKKFGSDPHKHLDTDVDRIMLSGNINSLQKIRPESKNVSDGFLAHMKSQKK